MALVAIPRVASASPDCIYSHSSSEIDHRYQDAAPDGSAMEAEGKRIAAGYSDRGTYNSGAFIHDMDDAAARYGYTFDCSSATYQGASPPQTTGSTAPQPPQTPETTATTRSSQTQSTLSDGTAGGVTNRSSTAAPTPAFVAGALPTTSVVTGAAAGTTAQSTETSSTAIAQAATGPPLDTGRPGSRWLPWVIGLLGVVGGGVAGYWLRRRRGI